jgi:hypothetical protein
MPSTTIFTSPQREAGISGGRAEWRGNHPPTLSREVFEWLKPRMIADPMCGSGTTGDVAKQMGISCWSGDLQTGFNLLADEIPAPVDLVWVHPPYWDIILYSGQVWGKEAHPDDLSRCPDYDTFIRRLDQAHYNAFQAVRSGGHLAILVGDVKRKGLLYSIQRDMRWYGEPIQVIIKLQHNVQSSNKSYGGNFVAIQHEYLVVTRKPSQFANAWLLPVRLGQTREIDQRGIERQGWRSIVWTALSALGGRGELQAIYQQANSHTRVKLAETQGTDWQAIIRRVLQESCTPLERGLWALPT